MIRSLRLSLRFLLPLLLAILAVAYLSIPLVDSLQHRWFVRDLDMRSTLVARSFEELLGDLLESNSHARIDALLERATVDERLYALRFAIPTASIQKTRSFPARSNAACAASRARGRLPAESSRGRCMCRQRSERTRSLATLVMLHDMFRAAAQRGHAQYILLLFTGSV